MAAAAREPRLFWAPLALLAEADWPLVEDEPVEDPDEPEEPEEPELEPELELEPEAVGVAVPAV